MIANIKKFLSKNPLTRKAYQGLYNIKHYKSVRETKKKRKEIQKNGVKLIHFIQNALADEFFFFDMGTLLGIIREGRLLGHDLDVDVGVFADNPAVIDRVRSSLKSQGCEHVKSYTVDGIGTVEDCFMSNGIKFDIGYYFAKENQSVIYLMYKDPNKPHCDGTFNVVELSCSAIDDISTVEFGGKLINIPKNSELYLSQRYGQNWRIPDKNYVYWKGPSTKPTDLSAKLIDLRLEK